MSSDRKKGAQPGNRNAWKDGRHSRAQRAEKRAQRAAEAAERRSASDAWAALMPATDYAGICRDLLTAKEAFGDLPRGFAGMAAALKAGKDNGTK